MSRLKLVAAGVLRPPQVIYIFVCDIFVCGMVQYVYMCIDICIYIHAHIHVYMYVYMYIYICIYI